MENNPSRLDLKAALQQGKELFEEGEYKSAVEILVPCAEAGMVEAEAALGVLYMLGCGVPRDIHRAISLLRRAAEKGSGIAAHNLGTLYMTCEPDMPLNPVESRKWFQIAADLGFKPGSNRNDNGPGQD